MHVVLDNENGYFADLDLILGRSDATVGDLVDALRAADRSALRSAHGSSLRDGADTGIVLDGRYCHPDLALDEIGLHEGARVTVAAAPTAAPAGRTAPLELRVVAGLDAGRRLPLPAEGTTVGRDDEDALAMSDVAVSRRHLRIEPSPGGLRATVTDLGSVNGSWVEGRRIKAPTEVSPGTVFEAGDVAFMVEPVSEDRIEVDAQRQAGAGGLVAFNRPPRSRRVAPAEALSPPEEPREQSPQRFSMVAAFAPLLLGAVMVVALHNILFALFMLLSPVMVIGGWWESRRQAGTATRGARRAHGEQLERFTTEVTERSADVITHLRASLPDPAEIVRRATDPSPRLWERRPEHDDFLHLAAGLGDRRIRPPIDSRRTPSSAAEEVLAAHERLRMAPVLVDLQGGGVVGIVGPRAATIAAARSLVCQAAVLHGPADLQIAVLTEPERSTEWDWAKWLPHARDASRGGEARLLAADPASVGELASELMERAATDSRFLLAVLDSDALIEGRGAVGRALLRTGEKVSGIVIARSNERLPAICTTVLELEQGTAEAVMRRPQAGESIDPLLIAGVSSATARECALGLARFEDADLQIAGGSLPSEVSLLPLLGIGEPTPQGLAARWRAAASHTSLEATFALAEDGPFTLDLVLDGPHGLIAGTTGSGKSELLRSLVAALATAHDPARLNFVLIDYKGGSAFAECAELPHTVGMVTDLDEQLGARALRSLEAELRYRERVLGEYRAGDLIAYQRLGAPALPRLLVIIDEFATLAAELPDFVASLVGIAQRGRSLGVHLLLATQRPSGAVNENIRANANLRICLRVQTPQDSSDVIDSPEAARIGRTQPGRAQVRLGPSELIPIQTALVTGATASGPPRAVDVKMFEFTPADGEAEPGKPERSDLQRLVGAARDAFSSLGDPAPRRPWLAPLEGDVGLEELLALGPPRPLAGERGLVVPLALADDPDAQAQYPVGWNLDAGNLLLYGLGGSGTTTTLATIALALADTTGPERTHIYVMDFGAGELASLASLPHVGAVTSPPEHERQRRLLRRLRGELESRRRLDSATRSGAPRIVVLLDGYAGFAAEHDDLAGDATRDALARVWADGPEVAIHMAISADRAGAVPNALASLAQQRLVFRLADLPDYAQFGIHRSSVPRFTPGRAVIGGSGQATQVARSRAPLAVAVAGRTVGDGAAGRTVGDRAPAPVPGGPQPIGVLPQSVPLEAVLGATRAGRDPWFIPLGIGDEQLEPAGFELYEGDHALISGTPRSGKTTALLLLAALVARAHPEYTLIGIALRPSRLRDCPELARVITKAEELPPLVEQLRAGVDPRLLLIDDAEMVPDEARALTALFSDSVAGLHAVVAGRADGLRSLGHWSAGVRRSRAGLLLQPDVQTDGALLGVTLPRRPPPPVRPGCGFLVQGGGFELVQVAHPPNVAQA
ncbi:MAG TPA: FtsK/SpoIIIE domain-containing protein [Solirubrobacteraceae bacterium]|nr:FtsK/SpoIIIE domain-containing protein [Solirubrobacteraceae bacterium]